MANNNRTAFTALGLTSLLLGWVMLENIGRVSGWPAFSPKEPSPREVEEPLQKQAIRTYNALYWRVADEQGQTDDGYH